MKAKNLRTEFFIFRVTPEEKALINAAGSSDYWRDALIALAIQRAGLRACNERRKQKEFESLSNELELKQHTTDYFKR